VPIAVKLAIGLAQVSVALLGVTVNEGEALSLTTVVEAMLAQPLLPTTVTEYTPAVITLAVEPPLMGAAPELNW
jgi:hypothetical protein